VLEPGQDWKIAALTTSYPCAHFFYVSRETELFFMDLSQKYMKLALKEAKKAFQKDEVPVGAVIVKGNQVLAKAYNKKESSNNAISHAEILAISKACKKINDWRLNDCVLYVTLQPCEMCMGAIKEARISKVIYALEATNRYYEKDIEMNKIECESFQKESLDFLQKFFKNKRK